MLPLELIVEGIITTQNADGSTSIAPMGPMVEPAMSRLVFRPFQTSHTYGNLCRERRGVFHVTDNVLMLAQAAIGQLQPRPELIPCREIEGQILADACRWYAFRVTAVDDSQPRAVMTAEVVARGAIRDFLGFNRAKHAVVEAAILATRVDILPESEIRTDLARLEILVDKTGSRREQEAFALLRDYVGARWASRRHA